MAQHWINGGVWSTKREILALLAALVSLPVKYVLQYVFATLLLTREGLAEGLLWRRFGAFIATGMLATLGMIAGFALFIIPGIVWALRWTMAVNFVIAENMRPVEAMKASWEATRGYFWTIFGAFTLIGLFIVVAGGLVGFTKGFLHAAGITSTTSVPMVTYVLTGLTSTAMVIANIAVFVLLANRTQRIAEVFD